MSVVWSQCLFSCVSLCVECSLTLGSSTSQFISTVWRWRTRQKSTKASCHWTARTSIPQRNTLSLTVKVNVVNCNVVMPSISEVWVKQWNVCKIICWRSMESNWFSNWWQICWCLCLSFLECNSKLGLKFCHSAQHTSLSNFLSVRSFVSVYWFSTKCFHSTRRTSKFCTLSSNGHQ